ncbi:hypothetical protein ACIBAI_27020 [Streptomyces sp. NPDC051041]|uniref:hypothetical protein n=1 Tax=Streptomyces sp. NPDC051041 TaxID=3365640 RepID=UPI0037980008
MPGSTPTAWHDAADGWRERLGRGTCPGVPQLSDAGFRQHATASYRSVPMPSAATLCSPLGVVG